MESPLASDESDYKSTSLWSAAARRRFVSSSVPSDAQSSCASQLGRNAIQQQRYVVERVHPNRFYSHRFKQLPIIGVRLFQCCVQCVSKLWLILLFVVAKNSSPTTCAVLNIVDYYSFFMIADLMPPLNLPVRGYVAVFAGIEQTPQARV